MPSEKYPLFCGLHLSVLTRRGLVTVSRTRFVNCWFSSDKPRTALIWYILRHEVFKNNPLCQWNFFEKKFRCPVLSVIKLVTTLKHPKISKGFWFYSDFPRLHTLFPTFPNNNFQTEQNHSFGVCRIYHAPFANATDISYSQTQKSRSSAPSAVSRDVLYSVCRQVSIYVYTYVYMYVSPCIY